MSSYSRFLIKLIIFSALVAGALYLWTTRMDAKFVSSLTWPSFAYFVLLTAGIHAFLHTAKDPKQFVRSFMLVNGLKMFLNLIIVVAVIVLNKAGAKPFAVTFLALYFLYLVFEVVTLLREQKS